MARNIKKAVGQRIRQMREAKNWSQEKLGEEANIHRNYIGQVERGEKNLGIENLVKIAEALGTTAASLLAGV